MVLVNAVRAGAVSDNSADPTGAALKANAALTDAVPKANADPTGAALSNISIRRKMGPFNLRIPNLAKVQAQV